MFYVKDEQPKVTKMNLYKELLVVLEHNNKSIEDICWVGGKDFSIPVDYFLKLANETNYDRGFGGQEVATDLMIVGKDWWMERHEYDGSEWFEFKTLPLKPMISKKPKYLSARTICLGWSSLSELNKEYEYEI